MMHRPARLWLAALGLAACALAACSAPSNPWRFDAPPTRSMQHQHLAASDEDRIIVVVGKFDDPSRAPNYSRGVGQAMSDAFSRALMRKGGFEVRINDPLAANARRYARFDAPAPTAQPRSRPAFRREALTADQQKALDRLLRDRGDVDYVVVGKVTDFYHMRDLPSEASRWGLFGKRNEAIVSFDLRIVDMHTMQVVGTDHLMGTANVGSSRSKELYENVALDSYVFWSTPLGRAASRAIDKAISRTHAMMPGGDRGYHEDDPMLAGEGESPSEGQANPDDDRNQSQFAGTAPQPAALAGPRAGPLPHSPQPTSTSRRFTSARPQILRVEDARRVSIMGGRNLGLMRGERFQIRQDYNTDPAQALLIDPVTGQPIEVAIVSVGDTTSTGWLVGQKPRRLDLRGMMLHEPSNSERPAAAHRAGAATSDPRD